MKLTFEITGSSSVLISILLTMGSWLLNIQFNMVLTLLVSILSICYLLMKIYDQFLITKNRKKDINDKLKAKS